MKNQAHLSSTMLSAKNTSYPKISTSGSATPPLLPVTVLGIGLMPLTSLDDLPAAHRTLILEAHTIACNKGLQHLLPTGLQKYIPLGASLEKSLQHILDDQKRGHNILVLANGDPLYFGIGATLIRQLGSEHVRIIPQVSSLQTACARLGLAWHSVQSCSLHGRSNWLPLISSIRTGSPVCILTDAKHTPDVIARYLLDRGVTWLRMAIFEHLDSINEKASLLSLEEAATHHTDPACTVLLLPNGVPRLPYMGLPTGLLAHHANMISKGPVRAAALALLHILPHYTVWDIGSGSGAVALEASVLAWQGAVFAVERDPMRAIDIQTNRLRTGAANVHVCYGSAPHVLATLPTPNAIFIGGGLGTDPQQALALLLEVTRRLAEGGRIVIACVLMGSLHTAIHFFKKHHWLVELECIQASEARALVGDMYLTAHNPVYLLAASKVAIL